MATKTKNTGNSFLSGFNAKTYQKQTSRSASVKKSGGNKKTGNTAKKQKPVVSGGSQYSLKQDKAVVTAQKKNNSPTQKLTTNTNKASQATRLKTNRTTRNYGTSANNGSQYSVANKTNRAVSRKYSDKAKEEREKRASQNKAAREKAQTNYRNNSHTSASQSRISNTIDTNKPEDRFTKRVKDITAGTLKSTAGAHLTTITHQNDYNMYDKEAERLTNLHKLGKLSDKKYDELMRDNAEREKRGKKKTEVAENKARALQERGDKQIAKGTKGLKGFGKIAAEAYSSGVGMATDMAFGGGVGSLIGMASRTYGSSLNSVHDLVKKGIVSAEEAERYAGGQAVKEVGTELMFKGAGLASGYAGAGKVSEKLSLMGKKAIDKATQNIKDNTLKNVASSGLSLARGAAEEAVEEAVGGALDPAITNWSYANRLDKDYRKSISNSATSITSARDDAMKQGYTRKQATELYTNEISSDKYVEDLAKQYIEDGMSKKRAYSQAKNMQKYLIACLEGDKETALAIENKMADGIKAKFSMSDTLEAMASAALMAGTTGAATSVRTSAQGANVKAVYGEMNGAEHAAESITKIAMGLSDKTMASRAAAMNKAALKGHDLSYEQYAELQSAIEEQMSENASKAKSARTVALAQAEKEGSFAQVRAERADDGRIEFKSEPMEKKAEAVRARTYTALENIERRSGEALEDKEALTEEIVAFEAGLATSDIVEYLTDTSPENRAVFESVTGMKLPKDNAKMRDVVYAKSIENYLDSARMVTVDAIDLVTGSQDVQFANSYGGEGQQLFHALTNNIGVRDTETSIKYRMAFDGIYSAGREGATFDAAMVYARDVHNIDEADAREIYNAGVKDRNYEGAPTVVYDVSDPNKIRNSEREAILAFARIFNTNFIVTDNLTVSDGKDEDGKASTTNASPQVNGMHYNNTIYLNLNDGVKKPVGYTIMHELTHDIESRFPEEYEAFSNLFKERWIEKNGQESYDSAISNKVDTYEKNNVRLSEKDALSEIIADQMGEVLHDEEFVNNIADEHPNIARALLDSIRNIIRRIRELFANYSGFRSDYNEATLSQLDMLKEAENLLANAITQVENARTDEALRKATKLSLDEEMSATVDSEGNALTPDINISDKIKEELEEYGVGITDSGTAVKYSLSSWADTDKRQIVDNLVNAGFDKKSANKWVNDVSSVAAIIAADRTRLDYEADLDQAALKPNSEYFFTLDLSTLCQKRRTYQGTYNAIMHRLVNYALSPEDTIEIRAMMDELGYEVPCAICYEESRKKNEGIFAERWLYGYKKKWKGYLHMEHNDPYIPTLDEVTTTVGRAKLRKEHPEALDNYLKYQRTRGSANPKVSFTHTDYRGDILKMTDSSIEKVKHIGGLRIQSFSDLETVQIIDMMQAIVDMASKKLTAQAYTKVPAFADIFGGTGVKINLSLIGRYNENSGKIEFDSKEGIDPDEAFRLRKKYSRNVGTILVGADDISILAAWADPKIDMVIPFHRSGWKVKEFIKLGINNYRDYTKWQLERYINGSPNGQALSRASKEHGIEMNPIYPADYWDETKTGKENAEMYLKLCAEKKYIPVFSNFLVNNGDGTWSLQPDGSTDGYWKSLVDFKMYDNDGEGCFTQEEVKPNFDMEAIKKHLDSYEGNADTLPVAEDVVEEFLVAYKEKHPKAQFSVGGYDGRSMSNRARNAYAQSEKPMSKWSKATIVTESNASLSDIIPSRDEVIRYSLDNPIDDDEFIDSKPNARGGKYKVISELEAEFTEIVRDNAKLTHGRILNRNSIRKQVSELVKSATRDTMYTTAEKREMTNFLLDTAEQVWQIVGKERPTRIKKKEAVDITKLIYNAADYVIGNARFISNEKLAEIIELRKYFRTHPVGVSESARNELGDDWNTIRKRNFGTVKFVSAESSGATNVADMLWEEFYDYDQNSSQIISLFRDEVMDAIEIGDEAELVRIIDNMMQNLSPVDDAFRSEFADDIRAAFTQDFARIILDEGEAWESKLDRFKQRYEDRIRDMKQRQKEAIRDVISNYNQRLKDEKAKSKQKVAEAKLKGKEKLQAEKEKQKAQKQKKKESENRKQTWNRIAADYKWLSDRLLKPKKDDFKHIPSDFIESVANFLEVFDLQTEQSAKLEANRGYASKSTEAMRELKDKISKYSSPDGGSTFVQNDFLDALINECIDFLDGRPLRELADDELMKVRDVIKAVRHMVSEQNRLFVETRKANVSDAGESIIAEAKEKVSKYGRRYDRTGISGRVSNLLNESMMTPKNFFDSLGGIMRELYRNLRHSQDEYIRKIDECRSFYGNLLGAYYNHKKPGSIVEEWQNEKSMQELTLSDGSVIRMTVAQMMSLYCLSKRTQALQHMCGSGIVISDSSIGRGVEKVLGKKIQNTVSGYRLTYNDISNIVSRLTAEQRLIADEIQNFMNTTMKDWGNETSLKMFDMEFFNEENYFPISVEQSELETDIGKGTEIRGNRITSFGMTKPLNEYANNKIIIGDIFSIAADHSNKMALYSAYAPALTDFNRVYNYKQRLEDGTTGYSVKGMLKDAYSNKALKFIDNLLDDINGQAHPRTDGVSAMINASLANYKKAAIGLNLRVLVQQPTAIMRSLYILHASDFTPDCFVGLKSAKAEMHKHCPIAAWKAWGNYQNDYTRSLEDVMLNKDWSRWEVVSMNVYGMADDITWAVMWKAVKNNVKKNHKDVEYGSEEFWNLCNELASEVFDETQVVDSVFHRSDAMRSKDGLTKLFTSFMAEPTRTYNIARSSLVKSWRLYKDGDSGAAAKELSKVASVVVLNALAISAAAAAVDAFRGKGDKDDKEDWLETFLRNFGENFSDNMNMLNNVVFVKDIVGLFENGFSPSNMALEGWYKLATGLTKEYQEYLDGKMSFGEWITGDFGAGLGYVTGVPTATIFKDAKAFEKLLNIDVFASDGTEELKPSILDFERNPLKISDGSGLDNVLNFFGINLTREEREERQFNKDVELLKKQTKGLSGDEKKEAINKAVMKGYTDLVKNGDFNRLSQLRQLIEAAGGDVEDFDEKVTKRTATEFKKTIGKEGAEGKQLQMKEFLLNNGWSEAKISAEIVYKSNKARDFKKACRELNHDDAVDALVPLIQAGITEADIYKLWDNRYKGSYDRYSTGKYVVPTQGVITSEFGYRSSPTAGASSYHEAIDIGAARGSVVSAADGGTVVFAGVYGGYGNQIVIQHDDGSKTYYSHLDYIEVKKGQRVSQKQYIGNVGSTGISTGPHLDFKIQNPKGDFVDPLQYFNV